MDDGDDFPLLPHLQLPELPGLPVSPGSGTELGECPASSRERLGSPARPASPRVPGFPMSPGGGTGLGGNALRNARRPDTALSRPAEGPIVSDETLAIPLLPDHAATHDGEAPSGQGIQPPPPRSNSDGLNDPVPGYVLEVAPGGAPRDLDMPTRSSPTGTWTSPSAVTA